MSSNTTQSLPQLVPTSHLREKIRKYSQTHREKLRAKANDAVRFGLGEIQSHLELESLLSPKDVAGLAGRIKRRKHATTEDMYRLSHAFLQNIENIRAFAMIPGAIQVLVKEFTGHDYIRQLSAAECLCNFSLGDSHICEKIASIAGSYLVTYLDSSEMRLKQSCLWTLMNILATDGKGAEIVLKMELTQKLWPLYTSLDVDQDFREDAAICLQQIALKSSQLLNEADLDFVAEHLTDKSVECKGSEYHLQIIFHLGVIQKQYLTKSKTHYLAQYAIDSLENAHDFESSESKIRIVYALRSLSNIFMINPEEIIQFVDIKNLVEILKKMLNFRKSLLNQEILWLVKNILLHDKSYATLLQHLRIYSV